MNRLHPKKRSSQGAYFALLVAFQEAHPDSFYEAKAEQEVAPIRAALRQTLQEIAAFEDLGDMHSKFEAIQSAKSKFAKIPEFDRASKRWATEAKDPAVKKSIAAGTAYAAVFAELSKLDDRLAKTQAKNKKITGKNKRTKAEQKAAANYEKKLKSLASKLEKLALKNSGTYYGDAAAKSHKAYVDSKGKKLADGR